MPWRTPEQANYVGVIMDSGLRTPELTWEELETCQASVGNLYVGSCQSVASQRECQGKCSFIERFRACESVHTHALKSLQGCFVMASKSTGP